MEISRKLPFLLMLLPQFVFDLSSATNDTETSAAIRTIHNTTNVSTVLTTVTEVQLTNENVTSQSCCKILIPKCRSIFDPYLRFSCTYFKEVRCGDICTDKVRNVPTKTPTKPETTGNRTDIKDSTMTKTRIDPYQRSIKSIYQNFGTWPYYYNSPTSYIFPPQPFCTYQTYWPYVNCNYNLNSHCSYCYSETTIMLCPVVCTNYGYGLPCSDFYSCSLYYGTYRNSFEAVPHYTFLGSNRKVPPVLAKPFSYINPPPPQ